MKTIYELIQFRGKTNLDRLALYFEGESLSYSELASNANKFANYLTNLGIKKKDRFAILDFNTPQVQNLLHGAGAIGAIPVILNWRLTSSEIQFILDDSDSKLFFWGENFASVVKEINIEKINLTSISIEPLSNQFNAKEKVHEEDIFVQLYTSGTTGFPKGVPLSNRTLLSVVKNLATELPGFGADSVNLVCAPFYHIGGVGYSLLSIYIGGESVLLRKFDPIEVAQTMEKKKITNALLVPAMLQAIVNLPDIQKYDFKNLRNIQHGGSPITENLLRKSYSIFQCHFTGAYGLTETSGIASLLRFDIQEKGLSPNATETDIKRLASVGKASPGMEILIKKEDDNIANQNELGEICIKGEYLFSGYFKSDQLDLKTFDRDGWFHTGDIGLIDEDGYLYLYDRKNDMILSKSENIYPIEVERVLAAYPQVKDVAVAGLPNEEYGEIVTAFIVTHEGKESEISKLLDFAKISLASYKLPRQVFFVDEIPRNPSGKILRTELKQRFHNINP